MSSRSQLQQRQVELAASAAKRAAGIRYTAFRPIEADARLAEIPEDTRNLSARLCGAPVFERSALAPKAHESEIFLTDSGIATYRQRVPLPGLGHSTGIREGSGYTIVSLPYVSIQHPRGDIR